MEKLLGYAPTNLTILSLFACDYGFNITFKDNVWLGGSVTVCPGVTIHEGSVIDAGSLVNKDIPPNSLAVGSPCKVIRKINNAL